MLKVFGILLIAVIVAIILLLKISPNNNPNKFLYNRQVDSNEESVNSNKATSRHKMVPLYEWPGPEYFKVKDFLIQDYLTGYVPKKTTSRFELNISSETLKNALFNTNTGSGETINLSKPNWINDEEWEELPYFLRRFIAVSVNNSSMPNPLNDLMFYVQGKYAKDRKDIALNNLSIGITSYKNSSGHILYAPLIFDSRWLDILKIQNHENWQKLDDFDKLRYLVSNCSKEIIIKNTITSKTVVKLFPKVLPANANWSSRDVNNRKLLGSREVRIANLIFRCWEIGAVEIDSQSPYIQRDFISPGLGYIVSWTWEGVCSSQAKRIWLNRQTDSLVSVDAREMDMQCLKLLIIPKDKIFLKTGKGDLDPWKSWKLGKPLFDKKLVINN